ncbi:MAG: choice-of-anchor D domain-containing protein [Actinomycetota bacterium]|nr:choice-of-anchor D domain-containing protein [Actinomycetota bacterium]
MAPSATGVALALGITPQSQDYGIVAPGATAGPVVFTVTNNGGSATGVLASSLSGANMAEFTIVLDNCSGVALAAAATCTVSVSFAPTSLGLRKTASLNVGTADGSVSAALSGTGVALGLGISPKEQDYGNVAPGATAGPVVFTVTNNGGSATGVLASSLTGANMAEFTIVLDNCSGVALAAAATCTVNVSFAPTSVGLRKTASLNVGTADGSVSAALSGTGVAP